MSNATKHSHDCGRVFSRLDPSCPCCAELAAGAPARPAAPYYARARARREADARAIAAHFAPNGPHARGACGPVCTAFDF